MQKITPFLWFNGNAEEAASFYVSLFPNSKITRIARYGDAGPGPDGSVMTVEFEMHGQSFVALNGGPQFSFTPAVSFFVHCTAENIDELFKRLSDGGEILMALDKYPFSEKYAFIKDRYGVAWQLMLSPIINPITPCLLFVGKRHGSAEEAVKFYTTVFKESSITHMLKYEEGEEGKPGTVKHCSFVLAGQQFMAMDGAGPHEFGFNESISFVVSCKTQEEVDYFWDILSAGGQHEACGWLKDRFGVSWQVVPEAFNELMQDPAKSQKVMRAMLQMKKLDIKQLQDAYNA